MTQEHDLLTAQVEHLERLVKALDRIADSLEKIIAWGDGARVVVDDTKEIRL